MLKVSLEVPHLCVNEKRFLENSNESASSWFRSFKSVTHPPISSYRCIIHWFLFFSICKKSYNSDHTRENMFYVILIEDMFVVSWSEVMTSGRRKKARCLLLSVLAAICSRQTVVFCVAKDNVRGLLPCTGEENT